jgi:hypothetical protein
MSNPTPERKCIEWTGRKNANGYGVILINGKQLFAHRLAVALSGRNIPKTKVCDHLCRNHACINPAHIELVSPAENTMRGEAISARNARSSSCVHGHPYVKETTRIQVDKRGRKARHCKRCYADRAFQRRRRANLIKNLNSSMSRYKYGN